MKNWKEYLFKKFSDSGIFQVDLVDNEDEFIETYSIKRKDSHSNTEIIFEIFKSDNYTELFNITFYNPDSPIHNEENKLDIHGFDGQGSTFNDESIEHHDDWLNIPLIHGWTEKTTFYKDSPVKTELIWIQNGKTVEIPLKQNYLDNLGCLFFPFVPIVIWWTHLKLKMNKDEVKIDQRIIKPMIGHEGQA